MKHALLAASLVLVAGTTVGCGGGAPTDASTDDFCGVFDDFYATVGALDEEPDDADVIKALKETGKDLEKVGTPKDISEDARAGFELTVQTIADLDDDTSQKELDDLEKEFSDEETKQSDAFDEYLAKTCDAPTVPDGEPTDQPIE